MSPMFVFPVHLTHGLDEGCVHPPDEADERSVPMRHSERLHNVQHALDTDRS